MWWYRLLTGCGAGEGVWAAGAGAAMTGGGVSPTSGGTGGGESPPSSAGSEVIPANAAAMTAAARPTLAHRICLPDTSV